MGLNWNDGRDLFTAFQISLAQLIIYLSITSGLFVVAFSLYLLALPRPIPGIPYRKESAKRVLGDIPALVKWSQEKGEMWSYINKLAVELNSPVFQLFLNGPFGRPWVVVADFLEARDIQTHRQGEFDRSAFIRNIFGPLMPGCHVWMPSNDEFRAHRSLIRDLVSPAFLQDVVVPAAYSAANDLIELWHEKMRLAQGQPFQADKDVIRTVVDDILLVSFGTSPGLNKSQAEMLHGIGDVPAAINRNSVAMFPIAEEPHEYTAIRTLVDSVQIGMSSPIPRQHMEFALRFYPSLSAARKFVNNLIKGILSKSWKRFSENTDHSFQVKSAADSMIQREAQLAAQQNRAVKYDTLTMRDELFGLYIGGHETSSSTLCWAVKHLTSHQGAQRKLRSALRVAHKKALDAGRLPSADEIAQASVPYLEAFIEESHRMGASIPTNIRRATRDAVILGHKVPKGTDIFMLINGPSFQTPAFPVEDSKRSATSRESKSRYGAWNEKDIGEFLPERFLVEIEDGSIKFNPFAGPVLPYGAGLRGCFGHQVECVEVKDHCYDDCVGF